MKILGLDLRIHEEMPMDMERLASKLATGLNRNVYWEGQNIVVQLTEEDVEHNALAMMRQAKKIVIKHECNYLYYVEKVPKVKIYGAYTIAPITLDTYLKEGY